MSEPRSLGKASKEFSEGRLENWYRSEVWGRGARGEEGVKGEEGPKSTNAKAKGG